MNCKAFSKPFLDALQPQVGQYEVRDGTIPGFSLRVSPGGTKTFYLACRFQGRKQRHKLGRYPFLSLASARGKARRILGEIATGVDPTQRSSQSHYEALKFTTLIDRFVAEYARPRNKSWTQTQRILSKNFRSFRSVRVDQIDKRMVWSALQDIAKNRGPQSALRSFAALRVFLSWCEKLEYIQRSPCSLLDVPWQLAKRQRVLEDGELRMIWAAADDLAFPFGDAVKLLLLTGQRRSEVAGMRWIDLHENSEIWIQKTNKSQRVHEVPLSTQAQDLLERLPRCSAMYVFPSRTNTTPISGFNKWKERLDRKSGVTDWTLHDLRRTVRTRMASMQIASDVVGRILNHSYSSRSAVEEIYNRYDYRSDKRHALQQWADLLLSIVAVTNKGTAEPFRDK